MEPIVYNVRLDTAAAGAQARLIAKRGDARVRRVVVHLYTNATPYELPEDGVIATLYASKPDGTRVYRLAEVVGDTLCVTITSQMVAAVGLVACELQIVSADGALLTAPRFDIAVEDTLTDVEESTDELTALTEALSRVANIEQSEKGRVEAEEARAKAETERAEAETARIEAEETREVAEAARIESEEKREEAETARALAEQARETAETARATAEAGREAAVSDAIARLDAKTENVFDEVDKRIEAAIAENDAAVAEAISRGDAAVNAAVGRADTAAGSANAAAGNANAAAGRVDDAIEAASQAADTANTAAQNADKAAESADAAATDANAAAKKAEEAAEAVEEVIGGAVSWNAILNKPETFPPSPHTHEIADVIGLSDELTSRAPLESPVLTGVPSAPTAAVDTNSDQLATTKFVHDTIAVDVIAAALTAVGWTGTTPPYTQTVAVGAVAIESGGSVYVAESATDEQYTAALGAQLRKTAQADGSITVKAYGDKPSVDIPITVEVKAWVR